MAGASPCASCKLLRRRCAKDCIFAPYFPPDDPHKFAMVHKVFGASNVGKMLQELPVHQRADAVSSLVYEANARMRDPVYGCVGAISYLQNQVSHLQMQLAVAEAEILCTQMQHQQQQQEAPATLVAETATLPSSVILSQAMEMQQQEEAEVDDKSSFFLSTTSTNNCNNNNLMMNNFQQYLGFASSSNVMQQECRLHSGGSPSGHNNNFVLYN